MGSCAVLAGWVEDCGADEGAGVSTQTDYSNAWGGPLVNIRSKPTLRELADYLDDHARSDMDNAAAAALRKYSVLFKVAHEMVMARTNEHSKAAYLEMIDLIKGRAD